jgi:hypothetical protein
MEDLRVHKERRQGWTYDLYEQGRLLKDLEKATLGRLSPPQLKSLVDKVEGRFGELLHFDAETEGWYVRDVDIREVIEEALDEPKSRIEHVLYALSIRGRVDLDRYGGWERAEDFLDWAHARYPDLAEQLPERPARHAESSPWLSFPGQPPRPSQVIKRSGALVDFRYPQFRRSIDTALVGRRERARLSRLVAQHVLWELAGQPIVMASQLASSVMTALRSVDDIAYLRWATVAKSYESVSRIVAEARALVEYPSPVIEFGQS